MRYIFVRSYFQKIRAFSYTKSIDIRYVAALVELLKTL